MDEQRMDETRVREIIREELSNFTPPKKKRAPNKWQLFLKECVPRQDKDIKYTEKVQLCSAEYRNSKGTNNQSAHQRIQEKDDKQSDDNK